jgi:hypothetical protein
MKEVPVRTASLISLNICDLKFIMMVRIIIRRFHIHNNLKEVMNENAYKIKIRGNVYYVYKTLHANRVYVIEVKHGVGKDNRRTEIAYMRFLTSLLRVTLRQITK